MLSHLHRQCLLNFSWKFPKKPNYHITIFNVTPQCEFKSFEKTKKKKKNYKVKGCKKTYDQINPLYKILLSLFSFLVIYEKEFVYFHLLKNMTIFVL